MVQSLGQAHTETIAKLDDVVASNINKSFVLNVPPNENIGSATANTIAKNFSIIGGVDSNQSLTFLNPVKVDTVGNMSNTTSNLPAALTGSGNLKVCIQELGNEGSERLNVDVGTVTQLPTALTGSGNLKVSIQETHSAGLASETTLSALSAKLPSALDSDSLKVAIQSGTVPAITGFNLETTQSALSAKISKGQDVKGVGEGLQQVLMYGRKPDGTLQPLETVGDRLLVDVLELAASGRITTSSALSSVQICGFDTTSARFKTLLTDGDGRLETNSVTKTTQLYSSQSITGNNFWSTEIDTSNFNRLNLVINSSATSAIALYGSNTSGGTFIPIKSDIPVNGLIIGGGSANIINAEFVSPPKFIKVANADAGGITIEVLVTLSN